MDRRIKPAYTVMMLMALVLMSSGCTTSVLLSSMSAAPSGATHISGMGGKLESYQVATFEDMLKATRTAADTLSLEVKREKIDADLASLQYADKYDRRADVVIERRTATMTYLRVNTGWFGAHGMGRLLLKQILKEISDAGDFQE